MAKRPVFIPSSDGNLIRIAQVEFKWHSGMSNVQKQKSVLSLHDAITRHTGLKKILEISTKSQTDLGVKLSAFNLFLKTSPSEKAPVEAFFQGSKVFFGGGPYTDIYKKTSLQAKRDKRLRNSGHLVKFQYQGDFLHEGDWPLIPKTAFYDWLYIRALRQNWSLAQKLMEYDAFTDIEFNPEKSINCQAAAAALYKSLKERDILDSVLSSRKQFLKFLKSFNHQQR